MENMWGKNIRKARESAGLTQAQLAEMAGINTATVNRYEKGHRIPDAQFLNHMVKIVGCSATWLLTGEGEMFNGDQGGQLTCSDRKSLSFVIDAVEKGMKEADVEIEPEKKTELLLTIYDLLRERKSSG